MHSIIIQDDDSEVEILRVRINSAIDASAIIAILKAIESLPQAKKRPLKIIACDGEETVVQFHPPKSEYVNAHGGCLHLWKCVSQSFPIPPSILVGPKTAAPIV